MRSGDQTREYCNYANRDGRGLDQEIDSGDDEKWLDFGFTWEADLIGFAEG